MRVFAYIVLISALGTSPGYAQSVGPPTTITLPAPAPHPDQAAPPPEPPPPSDAGTSGIPDAASSMTYAGSDASGDSVTATVITTAKGEQIQSFGYSFANCMSVKSASTAGLAPIGEAAGGTIKFPFPVITSFSIADFTNPVANMGMKEYSATLNLAEKQPSLSLRNAKLFNAQSGISLSGLEITGVANNTCKWKRSYTFAMKKQ